MTSPLSNPSLTSHVAALEPGAHVIAAHVLKDTPALALSDGTVVLAREGGLTRLSAHPDSGILVAVGSGDRLLTGGDDGRVVEIRSDGALEELGLAKGGAW
ncbi:MAG: WD40 repeat domain-containing protein, partial [Parafilimonas terrae]|nr:WD40 repeat domain-containing protein [Parafilimonas terrae]